VGEVEADGKVLEIRRIKQPFYLDVPREEREAVERVLSVYADSCPVARSVRGSIEISSEVDCVSSTAFLRKLS
jgi:organic hydroperoxide reductase OsmC/OhrA